MAAEIYPRTNDIEVVWHDLKAYNLAHQTFTGVTELDGAIHKAVEDLNRERMVIPLAKPRISAMKITGRGGYIMRPALWVRG